MTNTQEGQADDAPRADALPRSRYPTAIALGGGLAAAVGSSFIPMNAIEGFVSAYGIAELLPAAAPPLGNTARLALSTGIGTLTAGALLALLPREEHIDMGFENAVPQDGSQDADGSASARPASGFGASRLAGWVRTLRFGKVEAAEDVVTDFVDLNRLRIRNADQHPDAPVRAPILASSDLAAPLDALPEVIEAASSEPAPPPISADTGASAPGAGTDLAKPQPAAPGVAPSFRFAPRPDEPVMAETGARPSANPDVMELTESLAEPVGTATAPDAPIADLTHLDLATLLDRLETGLARRRQQASRPEFEPIAATPPAGRIIPLALAPAPLADDAPMAAMSPADPLHAPPGDRVIDQQGVGAVRERLSDTWPVPKAPAMTSDAADRQEQHSGAANADLPLDVGRTGPGAAPDDGEDDMDAALRDALATLRQLSDRQRNV